MSIISEHIQEINEIIKDHPEFKIKDIAEKMYMSRARIAQLIRYYNISYKPIKYKNLNKEEVSNYIKSNPKLILDDISFHFSVSRTTLTSFIKENNIHYLIHKRKYKKYSKQEIIDYIKTNPDLKIKEILYNLDIPISYILNRWTWKELGYISKSKKYGNKPK